MNIQVRADAIIIELNIFIERLDFFARVSTRFHHRSDE